MSVTDSYVNKETLSQFKTFVVIFIKVEAESPNSIEFMRFRDEFRKSFIR